MRLGEQRIELRRARGEFLDSGQGRVEFHGVGVQRHPVQGRQARISSGKVRVERRSLFQLRHRFVEARRIAPVECRAGLQIQRVGIGVVRADIHQANLRSCVQRHLQFVGDAPRDAFL